MDIFTKNTLFSISPRYFILFSFWLTLEWPTDGWEHSPQLAQFWKTNVFLKGQCGVEQLSIYTLAEATILETKVNRGLPTLKLEGITSYRNGCQTICPHREEVQHHHCQPQLPRPRQKMTKFPLRANGGPRSQIPRSAPHQHQWKFAGHISTKSSSNISPKPS